MKLVVIYHTKWPLSTKKFLNLLQHITEAREKQLWKSDNPVYLLFTNWIRFQHSDGEPRSTLYRIFSPKISLLPRVFNDIFVNKMFFINILI